MAGVSENTHFGCPVRSDIIRPMSTLAAARFGMAISVCLGLMDQTEPRFEVVIIKPTSDPPLRTGMFPKPGLLTIANYTLKRLVYGDQSAQAVSGPRGFVVERD